MDRAGLAIRNTYLLYFRHTDEGDMNVGTVFDAQQWSWTKAYAAEAYSGLMFNHVSVTYETGESRVCYVNVPSEFLKYIKDVYKVAPGNGKVRLYLDQIDGEWVFGFDQVADSFEKNKDIQSADLWPYADLPAWAAI